MNLIPHKPYSKAVRILICLLLLTSNSGGMVLCVDDQGQVEVKPAIHHKHDHGNQGGSHCLTHTHHHSSQKTDNDAQPDGKIKLVAGALKNCNDISIFLAQIDSKLIHSMLDLIPAGHIDTVYVIVDNSDENEIKLSDHFFEIPDTPLGILRTVILLT